MLIIGNGEHAPPCSLFTQVDGEGEMLMGNAHGKDSASLHFLPVFKQCTVVGAELV